ncbi:MAG: phytanoyl-CoA dioxygenase family protein [Ilumatobacteraceae bacterium]
MSLGTPDDLDTLARMQRDLRVAGAVVVPGLLDDRWCARLRDAIERCRERPSIHHGVLSRPGSPLVDSDLFRWTDDPDIYAVTHRSPLVAWAATLLGVDDVVLVEDQWFASEPLATTPTPWHQDQPYYRIDRPFLTVWVTLDDVDGDSSLQVVGGSHRGPIYAPAEFAATAPTVDTDAAGGSLPPVPVVAADAVQTWSLRAGDGVALDSRTLHATGDGVVAAPFRRISTRWAEPAARYVARSGTAAFWDLIPHGLRDGDLLSCAAFPLVGLHVGADAAGRRRRGASPPSPLSSSST